MYYRHFHPLSGQNTIILQEISSSHRPRFGPSRTNIHMSIFITAHFSPSKVGLKVVCVNPPLLFLHPLWSRLPSSLTICTTTTLIFNGAASQFKYSGPSASRGPRSARISSPKARASRTSALRFSLSSDAAAYDASIAATRSL